MLHTIPLGIVSSTAAAYLIEQSLLFNDNDSAYLNRTPSLAGNRKTWTFSAWVKRGNFSGQGLLTAGTAGTNFSLIGFRSTDTLEVWDYASSTRWQKITSSVFRDPSAWYHIVVSQDTTNATQEDRIKVYVNGSRVTSWTTNTMTSLSLNADSSFINTTNAHGLGAYVWTPSNYFDGLMALPILVDGAALAPTAFGETDGDGFWNPIEYTGSFGTNGFQLDFADSSFFGVDASENLWAGPALATNVYEDVVSLGYETNLEVALDAGASESYTSGDKFLDLTSNGYDFFRGADGTTDGTEPTFNGTSGNKSSNEYFSVDGADYFAYDTTSETWMDNLHKDNADFTLVMLYYYAASTADDAFASTMVFGSGTGMLWKTRGNNDGQELIIKNGATEIKQVFGSVTPSVGWSFIALSFDEAAGTGFFYRDGDYEQSGGSDTFTSTLSGASTDAAGAPMHIFSRSGSDPLPSGSRLGFFLGFSESLSKSELDDVYASTMKRFTGWSQNNFTASDQLEDSPTSSSDDGIGNFATFNALDPEVGTLSNGNLTASGQSTWNIFKSTIPILAGDKKHMEYTFTATDTNVRVGFQRLNGPQLTYGTSDTSGGNSVTDAGLVAISDQPGDVRSQYSGTMVTDSSFSMTGGEVVTLEIDKDAGAVYAWVDGVAVNSGATMITGAGIAFLQDYDLVAVVNCYQPSPTNIISVNFGQRPWTVTPTAGYTALSTQNLPDTHPLYTGTVAQYRAGATIQSITLNANSGGNTNYTFRSQIPSSAIATQNFTKVRIKMEASTAGDIDIDAIYIDAKATSGNAWDYQGTQVALTLNGDGAFNIPTGGSLWSDWVELSDNGADGLVVGFDIGASNGDLRYTASGSGYSWHILAATDAAATTAPAGLSTTASYCALVTAIEVQ